jgi:putative solute:sodium symporter small subunit
MELTEKHKEYWRRNLFVTAVLLVIWFVVTFIQGWYARELNEITFMGWPVAFYMSSRSSGTTRTT